MAENGMHERLLKRKLFYAALGECITAWSDIERQLFDLFHRALFSLSEDKKDKSALLFWTFPTFGMRLSYTSMLVVHSLRTGDGSKTKAQKTWKKLSEKLEELYSFRNILAHQPTSKDEVIPPADEEDGYTLIWAEEMVIPNKLDRKRKFKPVERADLEAHLESVSAIGDKLESFYIHFPSLEEMALETFSRDDNQD